MLTTLRHLVLGLVLVAGLFIAATPTARADFCAQSSGGTCTYIAITGDPADEPCQLEGQPVFCKWTFDQGTGYWSNIRRGYLVKSGLPWVWDGDQASGSFLLMLDPKSTGTIVGFGEQILPIRPVGPDPRQLANQAIAAMNLQPITIGIVPEPYPNRVGLVGLPTWMWVENPTENTVGPITRAAGSGATTVTATARMTRIVWVMGDGTAITCTTIGTKYEDRYGKSPSPTCGHHYTKQGTYTVSATSYWDITWTGLGQTGTVPAHFTSTATITMGELQVITTG